MGYIDMSIFNQAIDSQGENVTIEVYSAKTYSDDGDLLDQTSTSYDTIAIFNDYGTNLRFVAEGNFSENRYSFFFKGDQPGVETNNIVIRANGERWRIMKPSNHASRGKAVVNEAPVSNA
jgi:hypothetical protein